MRVVLVQIILTFFTLSAAAQIQVKGVVTDEQTGLPVSYVNIGILNQNTGTLSDMDGSYTLNIPARLKNDTVIFSALGFKTRKLIVGNLSTGREYNIKLEIKPISLDTVMITGAKNLKTQRLGWMRGKDGTLPVESSFGGACTTILLESHGAPFLADKVYLRILYNSKDTIRFRLRIYEYDTITGAPGKDLLDKVVIIKGQKRIGWIHMDLSDYAIEIPVKKFYLGFEWIEDRESRAALIASFRDWGEWKEQEYENGNEKVIKADSVFVNEQYKYHYRYQGNMMKWPGWDDMPPWTGLVVDDKQRSGNKDFTCFERKASFGVWQRTGSVLNAVLKVSY